MVCTLLRLELPTLLLRSVRTVSVLSKGARRLALGFSSLRDALLRSYYVQLHSRLQLLVVGFQSTVHATARQSRLVQYTKCSTVLRSTVVVRHHQSQYHAPWYRYALTCNMVWQHGYYGYGHGRGHGHGHGHEHVGHGHIMLGMDMSRPVMVMDMGMGIMTGR